MTTTKSGDDTGSRKLGLSCAECRRSKLKCDRTFPCQSCIRRGCAGICPEGTLAATKGNKVLMAQAQRLTEQVKVLNARVHELEGALAQAHGGTYKPNDHHLATPPATDLGTTENGTHPSGEVSAVSNAIGSLSLGLDGQARYHGESAGSEYLQDLLPRALEDAPWPRPAPADLPIEIMTLMHAFPFGMSDCPYDRTLFTPYFPIKESAVQLANIYYSNVAWMYDPISYEDFMEGILEPIYGEHGYINIENVHTHKLSVFFMVLAHGSFYDINPSAYDVAEKYYALGRAALSLDPISSEVTCATVQALFLVFRFIYNANQVGKEERWLLSGLAVRIGHAIGLQRDSAAWNLDHDEVQRRRRLYWELFVWETWSALVNGRPGNLMTQHSDCQFPDDIDPVNLPNGEKELGFHAWKFRYCAACLSISVEHVFSRKAPPYAALLAIDKAIHKFPVPRHLRCPTGRSGETGVSWAAEPVRALQQYCALAVRESNLLYIHRSYFALAIREATANPLQHKYAASVLATHRSAIRLIDSLRSLYQICPQVSYVWFFWSGIFSACVVFGAMVVESPACSLSREAMEYLDVTLPFFEQGSRQCRPPSVLSFLQKMFQRASTSWQSFTAGLGETPKPSARKTNEPDELEVLGGRKSVITSKSSSQSPSMKHSGSPLATYRDSEGGSSPGSQSGAAEMLMDYYRRLDTPPGPGYAPIKHEMELSNQIYYEQQHVQQQYQHPQMQQQTPQQQQLPAPPLPQHQQQQQPQQQQQHIPSYKTATSSDHVPMGGYAQNPHASTSLSPESQHPVDPSAHNHHHMGAQGVDKGQNIQNQAWTSTYPEQQQQYNQYQATEYMQYASMPMQLQQPLSPGAYGYMQHPAPLEQNQDDIWRNFMNAFGS